MGKILLSLAMSLVLSGSAIPQDQDSEGKITGGGARFTSATYGLTFTVDPKYVEISVDPDDLKKSERENHKVLCVGKGKQAEDPIFISLAVVQKVEEGTDLKAFRESVEKALSTEYDTLKKLGNTAIDANAVRAGYKMEGKGSKFRGVAVYRKDGEVYSVLTIVVDTSDAGRATWGFYLEQVDSTAKSFQPVKK